MTWFKKDKETHWIKSANKAIQLTKKFIKQKG
jgi:hypothetical protein